MASILSVGSDPGLLYSRNTVLKRAGAEVYSATLEPAMVLLEIHFFELVVLCHTLSADEVKRICAYIDQFWPASKILTVEAFASMNTAGHCHVSSFRWQRGPKALIDVARDLIAASDGLGQRAEVIAIDNRRAVQ